MHEQLLRKVLPKAWGLYFTQEQEIEISTLVNSTGDDRYDMIDTFYEFFRSSGHQMLTSYNLTDLKLTSVYFEYKDLVQQGPVSNMDVLLRNRPNSVLPCLGLAVFLVRADAFPIDSVPFFKLSVRINNAQPQINIGQLKSNFMGRFIVIKGTVVRTSAIRPLVIRCDFLCSRCGVSSTRVFEDGKYNPPKGCSTDSCRSRMFVPDRTSAVTVDYQKIKLQEIDDDNADPGRIPRTIVVELTEDLVDTCIPGDEVAIAGVVRSVNSEVQAGRSGKRAQSNSLYVLYLNANASQQLSKTKTDSKTTDAGKFDVQDIRDIQELGNQDSIFDRLVHSLCPGIHGNDIVKAGLLLSLFGGASGSRGKRSDSHVLVVGDPGLGKSQMLRSIAMVAPRAVYVCGNTTTTTGMTVTVSKDSNGETGLEAGALVLADQGVCCIDEFDKMGIDYQALMEAMEQQSVSIAKAGILCNLNARASVIAAANPVGGHYNRERSVCENLKMKAALLSRFDLIFVLLDRPDAHRDQLLSEYIMNKHAVHPKKRQKQSRQHSSEPSTELANRLRLSAMEFCHDPIPQQLLSKYVAYARAYIKPRLSPAAAEFLQNKYLEMRISAGQDSNTVPITTRQLESLIRLAQARAKMELRTIVTEQDAKEVVDILQESLLDTLTNESGELDFGRSGGMSLAKKVKAYVTRLNKAVKRRNNVMFTMDDLFEVANTMGLKVDNFYDFVDILRNECYILKKGPKLYKVQVSSYSQYD